MMLYPFAFLLLLTPLVFVHELGHFLFAKLFGVRVDIFSIGFGPKLWKFRKGETEYCLSAIPLGGYVKLYGQDLTEEVKPETKHRSFHVQDPWKRFLILLGGPLFNFLFAIVVFALMLMIGEEHIIARIGRVVPGSQAAVAGFRAGDVITSIDNQVVTKFDEIMSIVNDSANKELSFRVKRKGVIQDIKAVPKPVEGYSIYGENVDVGEIDGMFSLGRYPVVAVTKPKSIAAKAGLKTGDVVLSANGKKLASFEELEEIIQSERAAGGKQLTVVVEPHELETWSQEISKRTGSEAAVKPTAKLPSQKIILPLLPLIQLGIESSELIIAGLLPGSPAQTGGLLPGDYVISVNKENVFSFFQLREKIQEFGQSKGSVMLTVLRQGQVTTFHFTPTETEGKDITGRPMKTYTIGIYPLLVSTEPPVMVERVFNPFTLTVQSWSRAIDLSAKTFVSIKKLFFREVSMNTLGGPLLIGKLAGESMLRGIASFLKVMALISISLAIFNILPVPVLDGGHIFLLGIEVLRGKPMGLRQTELVQQVGLSLIMLLLVIVLFNDFSRVAVPALQNVFK